MSGLAKGAPDTSIATAPGHEAERYEPFGRKPLRTFALVIGLPAFLLYVGSACLVVVALVMMAKEIDRLENQRELTSVNASLESFLNGLSDAVADEGTWNEAYLNVVVKMDPAWMDSTWGATARLGTTYDDVMVTDGDGKIVFGENNAGSIGGSVIDHYPAASAMIAELDKSILASGDAAVISHFASTGLNAAGLAAISIHKTTPGERTVPRQQRRVLWIAKHITPALLQDMAVRYQTPLAEIATGAVGVDSSAIDIVAADGSIAGTVAWEPDRPGENAFRHALLMAFAVFFGIGMLLVLGLGALRRAMVYRARTIETHFAEKARVADVAVAAAAQMAARPAENAEAETAYSVLDGVSGTDFALEYQPIFDLRSETMVGVETLLRWTKPDRSLLLQEDLSANDCAAIMERSGIVALRRAADELLPLLGVMATITVTPDQLLNSVFLEKIMGTLGATHFQASRLQLSVDTTLLPDPEKLAGSLADIRRSGIAVAFSNFSLETKTTRYIRQGLADRLCLSPQLIAGVDGDAARVKLLEATVEAARAAGYAVTVAGIERKEEAAKVLRLGCREFRGNLLAKPMNIAALTSLILAPARPREPVKQAS
ncbi:MAG: EAL domain-containing protein [Devosia sp.]